MQLPIDPDALLTTVTDVSEARETPLSVSVYIDETASVELIAHIRSMFASSLPTVRMAVTYLNADFVPYPDDDIAIIIAGTTDLPGVCAADLRHVGVPVMVATTEPTRVSELASRTGYAIPEGDLVHPIIDEGEVEPVELNEENIQELDERIGRWIVSVSREKQLSFAVAFPFMRRALARDYVFTTALQNAGIALIPFIPGADLPILTLNQAKMALQIAGAYGQEMDKNRLKELVVVLIGAYFSRSIVRKLVGKVPILGFIFRTGVAFGTTEAIGQALIEYFEGGEDVTGVANVIERAAETGTKVASFTREKTAQYAPVVAELLPSKTS